MKPLGNMLTRDRTFVLYNLQDLLLSLGKFDDGSPPVHLLVYPSITLFSRTFPAFGMKNEKTNASAMYSGGIGSRVI
jgi:hypothetical protein